MSRVPVVARVLLGLLFFVFGLNGFLQFLPAPPEPPAALAFLGGLAGSGYFFPLLKATETIAGAALLLNRFVPLALTVLAPIVVNIVAFHAFLAPGGLPVALAALALELTLAWSYRAAFRSVVVSRAEPAASPAPAATLPEPAE